MPFQQIDFLTESQIADLHTLYESEWWTQGRSLDDVRAIVENSSLVVGLVDGNGKLVAFCRVLTDFIVRATIYDVIVAEPHRGQGLGRQVMDAVLQHPRLERVSAVWLCCLPEMVPFYEKWRFAVPQNELQWMLRVQGGD